MDIFSREVYGTTQLRKSRKYLKILFNNPGNDSYCHIPFFIYMRYDKGHVIFLSNGTAVIAGVGNGVDSNGEPDKYGTLVNVFYSAGIFALDFTFLHVFFTSITFYTF